VQEPNLRNLSNQIISVITLGVNILGSIQVITHAGLYDIASGRKVHLEIGTAPVEDKAFQEKIAAAAVAGTRNRLRHDRPQKSGFGVRAGAVHFAAR